MQYAFAAEMSLLDFKKLCDAARSHLASLPDIREHMLDCAFVTEWDPVIELEHEMDAITAEMSYQACTDTAIILLYILADKDHLTEIGATLYSRKLQEMIDAFMLKYPLLLWILISGESTSERAAPLCSHSAFVYLVAAELPTESPWRPEALHFLMLTGKCYLMPPISKACACYLLWGKIKYLPGETIDPLHVRIRESLFKENTHVPDYVTRLHRCPELVSVLIYGMDDCRELAALMSQTMLSSLMRMRNGSAAAAYAAVVEQGGYEIVTIENLFADATASANNIAKAREDKDEILVFDSYSVAHKAKNCEADSFAKILETYVKESSELSVGGSLSPSPKSRKAVSRLVAVCRQLDVWGVARDYLTQVYDALVQHQTLSVVEMSVICICLGLPQQIPRRVVPESYQILQWCDDIPYIANKALESITEVENLDKLVIVWEILCWLRQSELCSLAANRSHKAKIGKMVMLMLEKAFAGRDFYLQALRDEMSMPEMFFCASYLSGAHGHKDDRLQAPLTLSEIGEKHPQLALSVYKSVYRKQDLTGQFYAALLAHGDISTDELAADGIQNSELFLFLTRERIIDMDNVQLDPLAMVTSASVLHCRGPDT